MSACRVLCNGRSKKTPDRQDNNEANFTFNPRPRGGSDRPGRWKAHLATLATVRGPRPPTVVPPPSAKTTGALQWAPVQSLPYFVPVACLPAVFTLSCTRSTTFTVTLVAGRPCLRSVQRHTRSLHFNSLHFIGASVADRRSQIAASVIRCFSTVQHPGLTSCTALGHETARMRLTDKYFYFAHSETVLCVFSTLACAMWRRMTVLVSIVILFCDKSDCAPRRWRSRKPTPMSDGRSAEMSSLGTSTRSNARDVLEVFSKMTGFRLIVDSKNQQFKIRPWESRNSHVHLRAGGPRTEAGKSGKNCFSATVLKIRYETASLFFSGNCRGNAEMWVVRS